MARSRTRYGPTSKRWIGLGSFLKRGRLVLDAGGVLALARRDPRAIATMVMAARRDLEVVVPAPVIAQVHRSGRGGERVDGVLRLVDVSIPTSAGIARAAGELLGASGQSDAVDAIVVAEALAAAPAFILTSDHADLRAILGDQPDRARVSVISV